jgi:hypothetical protein
MADEPDFEKQLKALQDERSVLGEDEQTQAKRLFRENLIPSVLSICHTAMHSPNDALRFKAAQYVVERNLGLIGKPVAPEGAADPLEAMLTEIDEFVRAAAEAES